VIGRDTRESGPMLEAGLVEGITAAGGEALLAGVIPTPGVAVLVRELGADLGCVISASHNPYRDNGIKFLGRDGRKLPDADEARVERLIDGAPSEGRPAPGRMLPDAQERFAEWLVDRYGAGVARLSVAVDCANGAAVTVAPLVLERLGLPHELIGDEPDGRNINEGVGSTHLGTVSSAVTGRHACGIAFDGDADRCLAVDDRGRSVNGDSIIAAIALDRSARGELAGDRVVVTSMTNLGFHKLMREHGIAVEVTDVGDRYVLQRMLETGAVLGGEQSGHVVDLSRHSTGDGLATALMLLGALARLDSTMADVADLIQPFPQRLVGVPADRALLPSSHRIRQEVDAVSAKLGESGRVVLRASGTEPLVRVMVEAEDEAECQLLCDRLAALVREEIGT
jgi:phosphoglucosamine mutase